MGEGRALVPSPFFPTVALAAELTARRRAGGGRGDHREAVGARPDPSPVQVAIRRAAGHLIGSHGEAADAVAAMLDHAAVALAAERSGAAGHLTPLCVDYAKIRQQFSRPIGGFQAIKHKLADVSFDVERTDSIVRQGAMAATAKVFCAEAFVRIAAKPIQVHGGIGFTWEHQAHLYFRRAKSSGCLLGSPVRHRELLTQKLGV